MIRRSLIANAKIATAFAFLFSHASPTFAAEFNVAAFGAKADGHSNDRQAIQKAIDAAIEAPGKNTVVIPKGRYLLGADGSASGAQLRINHANGLRVQGAEGTVLISSVPQQHIFEIVNSSDVHVAKLVLDRGPLFAQATVSSVDVTRRSVNLRVEPGYEPLDSPMMVQAKLLLVFSDPQSKTWGDHSAACAFYKPSDVSVCWPPTITGRRQVAADEWELTLNTPPQPNYLGKRASIWWGIYKGRSFIIHYSQNVSVEDVTYHPRGGEGFVVEHCRGDIVFRRFVMEVLPGSGDLIAAAGAGMIFNNHANVILDHVNISNVWDDNVNMGANFSRINEQTSSDTLVVEGARADFAIGDLLSVWRWADKSEVAQAHITQLDCPPGPERTCRVKLDRSLPSLKVGKAPIKSTNNDGDRIDRVIDLDGVGRLEVKNSSFHSLHARCLLIKASNSIVEDSTCHDTVMAGILVGPQFFWDEGPLVKNLIVRGNSFFNVSGPNILVTNGGSRNAPPVSSITIDNNKFVDYGQYKHGVNAMSGSAIVFGEKDGVSVGKNTFTTSHSTFPSTSVLAPEKINIK